ncbi:MarR family transcriptional regulator [Myxococcus sp. CA056]|uniref:MarR family winged helix-turn-helix transcriptional regulator n=1 Tax=Myxococcus sp. CA056 TaxID=2741740 RepID=UPI00157A6A73|nr:MarR family transcriptional regulator [Myxococcus sp. CA056]NTX15681.1 MarR family transcriptional regulator [Myxococcus sp. CA056]NTX58012.1 MarR family transcriptional regulator [Myxococcus sp. CA039A]
MTFAEHLASLRRSIRRHLTEKLGARTTRPFNQLLALKAISEGMRRQSTLAERLMVDAPAASRLVDRLEEDGLVLRQAGEDRRCFRLELTAQGERELSHLLDALRELDGELGEYLPEPELSELKRLMEKLQTGLSLRSVGPDVPGTDGCGE